MDSTARATGATPIGQEADVGKWQPIETAPKDGTAILIWNPSSYQGKGGVFVSLYFKTRDYGMQWICHPGFAAQL